MPPPHDKRPPPHRQVPTSAVTTFVDPAQVDALLAPWVADANERAFVVRCILGEGPAHHRGANYVLLRLLGEVLRRLGPEALPAAPEGLAVPMRVPPHLERAGGGIAMHPIRLSGAALERLAEPDSPEIHSMLDCLTDGPPQHVLANVAMVNVLEAILVALDRGRPGQGSGPGPGPESPRPGRAERSGGR